VDASLLRVLLIEDDEDDYLITRRLIGEFTGRPAHLDWIKDYAGGLAALLRGEHDIALVDYSLGAHDGLLLLREAQAHGCHMPVIFLTGQGQTEIDMAAMQAGAADYLLKSQIDAPLLERSIRYALRHHRVLESMRRTVQENSILAASIHHANIGFLITDPRQPDNPIVFTNPAFTAITGYEASEAIGRNCRFLQGPDTDPQSVQQIREAVAAGSGARGLLLNYRKDGTPFWNGLTINPIRDAQGQLINFIGTVNDVTGRVQAEDELRRSEQRFRVLIEQSSDVICLLDEDYNIIYLSPSITTVLGHRVQTLIGQSTLELVHPDDKPMLSENLRSVSDVPKTLLYRMRDARGEWRWMESVLRDLRHDPSVGTIIMNQRDITSRKEAEGQLETSREQLRALAAGLNTIREHERAEIARGVHDELGQSMTGLKMHVSWLERQFITSGLPADSTLRQRIQAMSSTIDETIAAVQRISSNLRPPLLDDLGLEAAVEWQVQDFAERSGIRCECVATLGEIDLKPEQSTAVFRILQESLTNVARHAGATQVSVILEENNGMVVLEVQDNGRGIRQDEIGDVHSIGVLGMQERAISVGGTVTIRGEAGKSTTVLMRIPIHFESSVPERIAHAILASALPKQAPESSARERRNI
jgi:PAS domain S-box-containing protein